MAESSLTLVCILAVTPAELQCLRNCRVTIIITITRIINWINCTV